LSQEQSGLLGDPFWLWLLCLNDDRKLLP